MNGTQYDYTAQPVIDLFNNYKYALRVNADFPVSLWNTAVDTVVDTVVITIFSLLIAVMLMVNLRVVRLLELSSFYQLYLIQRLLLRHLLQLKELMPF